MTIVEYFDPRNPEHLRAWRELEADFDCGRFRFNLGMKGATEWPDDWGPLIIAKMANAWLEENIPPPYAELRENVQRVKLVPVDE